MKLSKIALAVAALTAGSGVMAAGLPTDLFIVATDTANNNSVIYDTGLSVNNPNNCTPSCTNFASPFNFASTQTFSVGGSNLLTDLGATAGQVTYSIVAQNVVNNDGLGGGIELDTSTNQTIPGTTISGDVVNANSAVGGFFNANIANFTSQLLIGNGTNPTWEWINATGGVNNGPLGGGAYQASTSASNTLKFYGLVSNTSDNTSDPPIPTNYSANGGYWSFNASAGTATWNATPVPLPAAVWMLLSGLAGVGAISRRRASSLAA
jgi:hypothetical protein